MLNKQRNSEADTYLVRKNKIKSTRRAIKTALITPELEKHRKWNPAEVLRKKGDRLNGGYNGELYQRRKNRIGMEDYPIASTQCRGIGALVERKKTLKELLDENTVEGYHEKDVEIRFKTGVIDRGKIENQIRIKQIRHIKKSIREKK